MFGKFSLEFVCYFIISAVLWNANNFGSHEIKWQDYKEVNFKLKHFSFNIPVVSDLLCLLCGAMAETTNDIISECRTRYNWF